MRNKRVFLLAALAAILTAVTTLVLLERHFRLPRVRLGLAYIGSAETTENGVLLYGPTFRFTNHTAKELHVTMWNVEQLGGPSPVVLVFQPMFLV
jgi:hypothetical protein